MSIIVKVLEIYWSIEANAKYTDSKEIDFILLKFNFMSIAIFI